MVKRQNLTALQKKLNSDARKEVRRVKKEKILNDNAGVMPKIKRPKSAFWSCRKEKGGKMASVSAAQAFIRGDYLAQSSAKNPKMRLHALEENLGIFGKDKQYPRQSVNRFVNSVKYGKLMETLAGNPLLGHKTITTYSLLD